MNRYATISHILRLKDMGMKEIYVHVDGRRIQVPTAHSGEPSGVLSAIMGPNDDAAVEAPELKVLHIEGA